MFDANSPIPTYRSTSTESSSDHDESLRAETFNADARNPIIVERL